jgi:hypothetical protein
MVRKLSVPSNGDEMCSGEGRDQQQSSLDHAGHRGESEGSTGGSGSGNVGMNRSPSLWQAPTENGAEEGEESDEKSGEDLKGRPTSSFHSF